MSKSKKRVLGKPVWIDDKAEWIVVWLVMANKMYHEHEPEYVRVIRTPTGWTGFPVGSDREESWHNILYREATVEETIQLNERYGIKVSNTVEKETG